MPKFNQMFNSPYAGYLPPEMQEAMQFQNMQNLGAALMRASGKSKEGTLARIGGAMGQYQTQQGAQANQMQTMGARHQQMQQAAGQYQGQDFASKMAQARLSQDQTQYEGRQDTTRRGQDMALQASRYRSDRAGGLGFGGFNPNAQPTDPVAAANARIAAGQGTAEDFKVVSGAGAKILSTAANDPPKTPETTPIQDEVATSAAKFSGVTRGAPPRNIKALNANSRVDIEAMLDNTEQMTEAEMEEVMAGPMWGAMTREDKLLFQMSKSKFR